MSRPTGQAKLSQVIQKNPPLFAQQVKTFEEAYPTVSKLRATVVETGGAFNKTETSTYTHNSFRHSVDCNNGACYGGGIEIGNILHDMVAKRERHFETTKKCCGYEGNSRKKHRDCLHFFKVTMDVEYKGEPAKP